MRPSIRLNPTVDPPLAVTRRQGDSTSICQLLRDATAEAHRRIESLVSLPQSTLDHVRTLKIFFGFIEPWEQRLRRVLAPSAAQPSAFEKTSWLEADLRYFGRTEHDLAALPRCQYLPCLENTNQALGSLYVLEGATLGGQILARHVERQLELIDGQGYRFFSSYGPDVGRHWTAFKSTLEAHASPTNQKTIIRSAVETFERLYDWFVVNQRPT
jgi:heme oxygenase